MNISFLMSAGRNSPEGTIKFDMRLMYLVIAVFAFVCFLCSRSVSYHALHVFAIYVNE